jgi:hypothetical protein
MIAERGLSIVHTTIMRWVQHYAPEFERRWNRIPQLAGTLWRLSSDRRWNEAGSGLWNGNSNYLAKKNVIAS